MKVFIDTNVILDVLCKRDKFYNDSLNVLKLCEANIIKGYLSALSITNIIYIFVCSIFTLSSFSLFVASFIKNTFVFNAGGLQFSACVFWR